MVGGIDVSFLKSSRRRQTTTGADLFAFKAFNADRLELVRDGQSFVFEKVKSKDTTPDKGIARRQILGIRTTRTWKASSRKSRTSVPRRSSIQPPKRAGQADGIQIVSVADSQDVPAIGAKTGADVYASATAQPGAAKVLTTEFDATLKALDEVSK
jgi:hypothetical protein